MDESSSSLIRGKPDRGYSWLILMISFFICFMIDGLAISFANVMINIVDEYNISENIVNYLGLFRTTFMFLSGPLVTSLINHYGSGEVIIFASLVSAIIYFLIAFIQNIWFMLLFYGIIGGISSGCIFNSSLIVLVEYFEKRRGLATGIAMSGSAIGALLFGIHLGKLTKSIGLRWASIIDGLIILMASALGVLIWLRRSTRPIQIGSPVIAPSDLKGKLISILKDAFSFGLLRTNSGLTLMAIANFLLYFGMLTPYIHFVSMNTDNFIMIDTAIVVINMTIALDIPLRIIYGFMTDQKCFTPVKFNTLALFFSTVSLMFYYRLQNNHASQVLFAIVFTFGSAGMNCLVILYSCYLVGVKDSIRAYGIIMMFRGVGYFLGVHVSELVVNKLSATVWMFFSAFFFSIALIISFIVSYQREFIHCLKGRRSGETQLTEPNMDTVDDAQNDDLRIDANSREQINVAN